MALADPRPGERVLDVACGTGVVTRLVAQRVGRTGNVVGLDLNPGMLAVAASSAATEPPTSAAPITWQAACATKMPLPDAVFDIAYCQLGLQFFPDRPAALREMYRVTVPGGRLGLMVWRGIEHSPGFGILAAARARYVSTEAAGVMRAPFALADAEELRMLVAGAGCQNITIRRTAGTVRFPSAVRDRVIRGGRDSERDANHQVAPRYATAAATTSATRVRSKGFEMKSKALPWSWARASSRSLVAVTTITGTPRPIIPSTARPSSFAQHVEIEGD